VNDEYVDQHDIDNLAHIIHAISTGKGFTPPSLQNLPEKLMLSVSELAEALEEHRSGKPLLYFKCPRCGREEKSVIADHMIPEKPGSLWGWIKARLGITAPMPCPGQVTKPEGVLTEIGDSIIRNLHMMHSLINEENRGKMGEDWFPHGVSDVLNIKVAYNNDREAMHGRKY
jgi:hypothetical protein